MNIQVFGVRKCFDTQKAERYFKERNVKYQFVDLHEKGLSKRELESIKTAVGVGSLINIKAKEYKLLNIEHIRSDDMKAELLLNHPKLYKTPIVRNGRQATIGYQPEVWREWE